MIMTAHALTCSPDMGEDRKEILNFYSGLICQYTQSVIVEPLYKDSPEMRTSPLIRTPSSTVPATKTVYKTTPELNEDTSLNQDIDTLSCPKGWLEKFHSDSFILDTTHNIMLTLVHTKSCKHSYTHTRCKSVTLIKTSY